MSGVFFADNLKPLLPGDSASQLGFVVQWLQAKDIFQQASFLWLFSSLVTSVGWNVVSISF